MHGGISPQLTSLDAINLFDRKMEPPDNDCLMTDLLWADPARNAETEVDYTANEKRGAGIVYGKGPVNEILEITGLKCIIRAHECKKNGYKQHCWNGPEEFPPVITIFSAPNYCGTYGNKAAIFISEGEDVDIKSFSAKEDRPFLLPEHPLMDAFTFFHDDVTGYALAFLFHMTKAAAECIHGDLGTS